MTIVPELLEEARGGHGVSVRNLTMGTMGMIVSFLKYIILLSSPIDNGASIRSEVEVTEAYTQPTSKAGLSLSFIEDDFVASSSEMVNFGTLAAFNCSSEDHPRRTNQDGVCISS